MSQRAVDRTVRAVYVPANGAAVGVARLEVTALAAAGAWTLLVYPTGGGPPRRTPLTAAECREVVRQWGWAVRRGQGTVRLG